MKACPVFLSCLKAKSLQFKHICLDISFFLEKVHIGLIGGLVEVAHPLGNNSQNTRSAE
jgi:hypothetical protein